MLSFYGFSNIKMQLGIYISNVLSLKFVLCIIKFVYLCFHMYGDTH